MTKKEMYTYIAENFNGELEKEVTDFCVHEIEMLNKRATSKSKALTATQKANIPLKEAIVATLNNNPDGMTVKEIGENCSALAGMSSQKITGLVRGIDGVTNEKIGKSTVYKMSI